MSSFPHLLRRSNFITHDPLVSRIYSSPPSSLTSGDYGLKFPVHRRRRGGPTSTSSSSSSSLGAGGYIRVSSLDGGRGVGADWKSGEKEARFVQTWGKAGVAWTGGEEDTVGKGLAGVRQDGNGKKWDKRASVMDPTDRFVDSTSPSSSTTTTTTKATKQVEDTTLASSGSNRKRLDWMPDVESMTQKQFDAYLARLRSHRSEFKSFLSSSSTSSPSVDTLPELVAAGMAQPSQPPTFLSRLEVASLSSPSSTRLHSKPHRTFGLSYAPPTAAYIPSSHTGGPGSTSASPTLSSPTLSSHKGRVLNRYNTGGRYEAAKRGSMAAMINSDYVVSLGGLTAHLARQSNSTIRGASDLTPSDLSSSVTEPPRRFRVTSASIQSPPNVLALARPTGARWTDRESAARVRSAFDTFRFDVSVELAEEGSEGAEYVQPGSRKSVAREPMYLGTKGNSASGPVSRAGTGSNSNSVLGSNRASRIQGEGMKEVNRWEKRQAERRSRRASAPVTTSTTAGGAGVGAGVEGTGSVEPLSTEQVNKANVQGLLFKLAKKAAPAEGNQGEGEGKSS